VSNTPLQDFSIKYGGRALGFTVIVNTDEDPAEVAQRLSKAARGQQKNATVVGAYVVTPEELKNIFAAASAADRSMGRA
jgi:hypothetical protein